MEAALTQRDPKLVTSALRRCVLNAERCVQRIRLSDIVLSVSSVQRHPHSLSDEASSNLPNTPESAINSSGNDIDQCLQHYCGICVWHSEY